MSTINSNFLKNSLLTLFYTLSFSYSTNIKYWLTQKDSDIFTGDFVKLENSKLQYLTTSAVIETKNKGYLLILVPNFISSKVIQGTIEKNVLDLTPAYSFPISDSVTESKAVKVEVGKAHGYSRRLKSLEGVNEVGESLRLENLDEVKKDLKKYTDDEEKDLGELTIYLEFIISKEAQTAVNDHYNLWKADGDARGTSTAALSANKGWEITVQAVDLKTATDELKVNDQNNFAPTQSIPACTDDTPCSIVEKGSIVFSTSPITSTENEGFFNSREFVLQLNGEASADIATTFVIDNDTFAEDSSEPGYTVQKQGDVPEYHLKVVWSVPNTGEFKMTSQTEGGEDLPLSYVNEKLDTGIVIEYMKKTYHNLTALWVVIGIVGAVLVIGIICAFIFCK